MGLWIRYTVSLSSTKNLMTPLLNGPDESDEFSLTKSVSRAVKLRQEWAKTGFRIETFRGNLTKNPKLLRFQDDFWCRNPWHKKLTTIIKCHGFKLNYMWIAKAHEINCKSPWQKLVSQDLPRRRRKRRGADTWWWWWFVTELPPQKV